MQADGHDSAGVGAFFGLHIWLEALDFRATSLVITIPATIVTAAWIKLGFVAMRKRGIAVRTLPCTAELEGPEPRIAPVEQEESTRTSS